GALGHQSAALVLWQGFGLDLFDAFFKIPGELWRRLAKTHPPDDERKQGRCDSRYRPHSGSVARQTVHTPISPSVHVLSAKMRVFAGKPVPRCSNVATALRFVCRGEFLPSLSTSRRS